MHKVTRDFSCRSVDKVTYRSSSRVLIEFQKSPDPHLVLITVQSDQMSPWETHRILHNTEDRISVLEGLIEIWASEVQLGSVTDEVLDEDSSGSNPPLILAPIVFAWRILSGIVRALLRLPKPKRHRIKVTVRIPHNTKIREIE